MDPKTTVWVVGAGIAGLAAGITLQQAGQPYRILEASNAAGGRVRTDHYHSFLLDRGFQVLLKEYPEAKRFLDYSTLDLRPFLPGATIINESGRHLVMDPLRKPEYFFQTLFSPVGTLLDKLKLLQLRLDLSRQKVEDLFLKEEIKSLDYLRQYGFGEGMIDQFFRPFLGGIFLENELSTSSRLFEFVYKLFSSGDTVVPAGGMEEIPKQMVGRLDPSLLQFDERFLGFVGGEIRTNRGNYRGNTIIMAGGHQDEFLLDTPQVHRGGRLNFPRSALTLYFSGPRSDREKNIIYLNASKVRLVGTLAFMDQLSEQYAPPGQSLISITLKEAHPTAPIEDLVDRVKKEMTRWFPGAPLWEFVKAYPISYALPDQDRVLNTLKDYRVPGYSSVFACGDYTLHGSIHAAMKSGREAAEQFLKD